MTDPRLDEWELERLVSRYADAVSRHDRAALAELFEPDAVLRLDLVDRPSRELQGRESIVEFISSAVRRFEFVEPFPLNVIGAITSTGSTTGEVLDGARARIRTHMCEVRRHGPDDPDAGCWSTAFGLYQDDVVRRDGHWRFTERSYRSLARTGAVTTRDGLVFPPPDLRAGP